MKQLRLTPFEEYMLLDSRPSYPMSCFLKLTFSGRLDPDRLGKSLKKVLQRHPLLQCGVTETVPGLFYWQPSDLPVEIRRATIPEGRVSPRSTGIDLFRSPATKIDYCPNPDGTSALVFEFHHSACDAAGSERFVEDLLLDYVGDEVRDPVDPATLPDRADFSMTSGEFLKKLPGYVLGIPRVVKFLLSRVLPLTVRHSVPQNNRVSDEFPAILARQLDEETTETVRRQAKSEGVTINDRLLRATFLAMNEWRKSPQNSGPAKEKGVLRIAVPMNLRTEKHRRTPAANIVSMVFMDRKPAQITSEEGFMASIHREMEHIKRRKLGLTFIRGLAVYRKLFGSLSKMVDQDRCWATATVSNLGPFFARSPLPKRDGRVRLEDGLELIAVDSVPPIRHLSALGICVLTYAGRMTIDLQYDADVLSREEADLFFEFFLRYFTSEHEA